jgi:hypothetical protein
MIISKALPFAIRAVCSRVSPQIWFIAAVIFMLIYANGCAQMFTSKTTVHFETRNSNGDTCIGDYTSDKEQIGLEAIICGGATIKVDKASTQEAVVAAVLSMQSQMLQFIKEQAAVAKAAGS